MKVRITIVGVVEVDPKWIDEDGRLTHIADPAQVGGAAPIEPERRAPVLDALERTLHPPYYIAGSTPRRVEPWKITVEEI